MITNEQALELYELAQLGDNREEPPVIKLKLWRAVAAEGGWTYPQGFRAIIEHRTYKPGVYLEPGHITQRVAEVRDTIRARWYCPPPPRELADDPRAEIQWRRRAASDFVERNLALWAAGKPFEDVEDVLGLENEKRGAIPSGPNDSPAKRAAQAEIHRFTRRTIVPEVDVEAERARRAEERRRRFEAVDACPVCDDEGLLRYGDGFTICSHPRPRIPGPRDDVCPAVEATESSHESSRLS